MKVAQLFSQQNIWECANRTTSDSVNFSQFKKKLLVEGTEKLDQNYYGAVMELQQMKLCEHFR